MKARHFLVLGLLSAVMFLGGYIISDRLDTLGLVTISALMLAIALLLAPKGKSK